MSDWLKELKVGDKVFVAGRFSKRIAIVERLTKTQCVITGSNTRYRRDDGREIGKVGRWSSREYLQRCSPSDEESYLAEIAYNSEVRSLSGELEKVSWRKLPLATLRAIAALIEEGE